MTTMHCTGICDILMSHSSYLSIVLDEVKHVSFKMIIIFIIYYIWYYMYDGWDIFDSVNYIKWSRLSYSSKSGFVWRLFLPTHFLLKPLKHTKTIYTTKITMTTRGDYRYKKCISAYHYIILIFLFHTNMRCAILANLSWGLSWALG